MADDKSEEKSLVTKNQYLDKGYAYKIAAMLDIPLTEVQDLNLLPRGWHFPLLGSTTPRHSLREDGFPGFGVPMPDVGLPRLLMTGRSVSYKSDIPFNSMIECQSRVSSLEERESNGNRRVFITLTHELFLLDKHTPCLTEDQFFVMLSNQEKTSPKGRLPSKVYSSKLTLIPDSTMLFQYSALGFNSHKIHIDRQYAKEVEKLPDLVVNGGLSILLIKQFLRNQLEMTPKSFNSNHFLPLYCDRPLTISGQKKNNTWEVSLTDNNGFVAVVAKGVY